MKFFSSNIQEENLSMNKPEESKGLFGSIKGIFTSTEQEQPEETGCKDKIINMFEVETSYFYFFVVLAVGGCLLFLSLFFLPYAIVNPQKFVSLFSLGSLITIGSFVFLYGTRTFVSKLFDSGRRFLTILYLASIIIGLTFAFSNTWMIVSHICAIFQLITLVTFVLSFVPGGHLGINFIWGSIKSIFVKA